MAETIVNPKTGERLQLNEATNQWEPVPLTPIPADVTDPRNIVPSQNLSIGVPPTVERGTFANILDTITGGQSKPENLRPLPVEGGTQAGAGGRGFMRGMVPFIEPAVAALDLPFREIPGREDISAGDLFSVSLDQMKRRREKDRREFGGTAMTSEIAGTLPASLAVASIPKVTSALRTSPVLTSGKIGAGFGGVYGGSQAEDLQDVPGDVLTGAAIGGGAGLGAGFAVDRFLAPSTRAILNSFKTARGKSNEILSKFMRDIFPDTKTALTAAKEVASPETALIDVSRGTQQLGRTLSAESPRFGQRAQTFLKDRAGGAIERVNNVTNKILGTRGKNVAGTLKDLQQQRFQQFTDIIDDVYQQPVNHGKVQAFVDQIDDAIERTQGVKGFSTALKQLKRSLYKDPKMEVLKDDFETLHLARKAYGDVVNKAGGGAKPLLRQIREGFDDVFPAEYKTANSIWSDSKKVEEATLLGRKVLREDVDILTDNLARMPQAEKEGFLIGVARAIDDVIKTPQEGGKVTGTFNKPIVQERLRAVMPDENVYNEFMSRVGKENTFNLTKNAILAGSQTYEGQAAQRALEVKAAQFGEGDLKSGAIRRGVQWLTGIKNDKNVAISDDVIDALSDDLLTAGKVTPAFIDKLMKTPLRARVNEFINMSIAPASTTAATQGQEAFLRELPPE